MIHTLITGFLLIICAVFGGAMLYGVTPDDD